MKNNKETLIIEVARRHFVQRGFAATRMQDIADEAGVNKALVHYYFRSKEKLYQEIIIQTLDKMVPRLAAAMRTQGSFWEKVEGIVSSYVSLLLEEPDTPFFIMSELSQKQERFLSELKKRAQFFPAIQEFVVSMHQEMEAGNIKKVPPFHVMLNIMSMTVFPFIAKPIFCTIFDFSEADFNTIMKERTGIIMQFLKAALDKE